MNALHVTKAQTGMLILGQIQTKEFWSVLNLSIGSSNLFSCACNMVTTHDWPTRVGMIGIV